MEKLDNVALANTIITTLIQQGHGDDYINASHLMRTAYMLNIIYYLKYHQSALSQKALQNYKTGIYGPYCDDIQNNFDPIAGSDEESTARQLKNSLQEKFLFHEDNVFDVKVIPFDLNEIDPTIRQIARDYAEPLWTMSYVDLSNKFKAEPQMQDEDNQSYSIIYNFNKSINWFSKAKNQFWITSSQQRKLATEQAAKEIKNNPLIDTEKLMQLLQEN